MKYLIFIFSWAALLAYPVAAQLTPTPAAPDETAAPPPTATEPFFANAGLVDAYFSAEEHEIPLGVPFQFTLIADAPLNTEIVAFPTFPDGDPIEILDTTTSRTTEGNRLIFRHTYDAVFWQTGEYLTPQTIVEYRVNGGTVQADAVTSAYFTIPTLINQDANPTMRPWVAPIDLPYLSPWWIAGGIAIIGGLAMAISRGIQSGAMSLRGMTASTPVQITIARLEDLKHQQLPADAIYPLVADYLRQFLQQQYSINVVEMTTREILHILHEADIFTKQQRKQLQQLLEQADLVKFARFQPDRAAGNRLVNFAIRWLRESTRGSNTHDA